MKTHETLDFDEEARRLFESLGIGEGEKRARFNNVDAVWKHPTNGATLYVGNQSAAQSRELLESKGITRIVNCTDNIPNFFEGKRSSPDGKRTKSAHSKTKKDDSVGVITYLRFAISFWSRSVKDNDASVIRYLTPLFEFVDESLANGQSVMVHCLAGAHRAGTTGVMLLMRYTGINDVKLAIKTAKTCRPIIDPIGMLPELLNRYAKARENGSDLEVNV